MLPIDIDMGSSDPATVLEEFSRCQELSPSNSYILIFLYTCNYGNCTAVSAKASARYIHGVPI